MLEQLKSKEKSLGVIGLGYVGLPIALEFAKRFKVVGFDINAERVQMMQNGQDPSEELEKEAFEGVDIQFTHELKDLEECTFYVVAVPTPINKHLLPDLKPLLSASRTVGQVIKKGDIAVFESTVYPGCTEEDCLPILEEMSGLKAGVDFKIGYSPERINPGDKEHTLTKITKVTSGMDEESADIIADVYGEIIEAGIHKASSIKVAEAAKVIENTQRDLNIALMNELSMIFDKLDINTYEVLEAAGTKWNFLGFKPGLVGGHCIGVDPYYLTYKAQEEGFVPEVILSGRSINDGMGAHVAKSTIQKLVAQGVDISKARVLVLGTTFKENVSDIRNSKVVDVIEELKSFSVDVEVYDPLASSDHVKDEYGYSLIDQPTGKYEVVILAVIHDEFLTSGDEMVQGLLADGGLFVDLKGAMKDVKKFKNYWSL